MINLDDMGGLSKQRIFWILLVIAAAAIFLFIRRSIPYSDSKNLQTANISLDSIWSFGPTVGIYDKASHRYFWLKSYTSFDNTAMDTLRSRHAKIRFMKFMNGPLENRIYWMQIDSTVVFDQVINRQ